LLAWALLCEAMLGQAGLCVSGQAGLCVSGYARLRLAGLGVRLGLGPWAKLGSVLLVHSAVYFSSRWKAFPKAQTLIDVAGSWLDVEEPLCEVVQSSLLGARMFGFAYDKVQAERIKRVIEAGLQKLFVNKEGEEMTVIDEAFVNEVKKQIHEELAKFDVKLSSGVSKGYVVYMGGEGASHLPLGARGAEHAPVGAPERSGG